MKDILIFFNKLFPDDVVFVDYYLNGNQQLCMLINIIKWNKKRIILNNKFIKNDRNINTSKENITFIEHEDIKSSSIIDICIYRTYIFEQCYVFILTDKYFFMVN